MSMPWRSWGGGDSPGQEEKLLHFAGEVGSRALAILLVMGAGRAFQCPTGGGARPLPPPAWCGCPGEAVDLDRVALSLKAVPREQLSGQLVSPIPSSWGMRRRTWAPLSLFELLLTHLSLTEQ